MYIDDNHFKGELVRLLSVGNRDAFDATFVHKHIACIQDIDVLIHYYNKDPKTIGLVFFDELSWDLFDALVLIVLSSEIHLSSGESALMSCFQLLTYHCRRREIELMLLEKLSYIEDTKQFLFLCQCFSFHINNAPHAQDFLASQHTGFRLCQFISTMLSTSLLCNLFLLIMNRHISNLA